MAVCSVEAATYLENIAPDQVMFTVDEEFPYIGLMERVIAFEAEARRLT